MASDHPLRKKCCLVQVRSRQGSSRNSERGKNLCGSRRPRGSVREGNLRSPETIKCAGDISIKHISECLSFVQQRKLSLTRSTQSDGSFAAGPTHRDPLHRATVACRFRPRFCCITSSRCGDSDSTTFADSPEAAFALAGVDDHRRRTRASIRLRPFVSRHGPRASAT